MAVNFFYGELTKKLNRTLTQRFTELYFSNGSGVPTTADLDPGVQKLSVDILQGFGEASLLAPGAEDIPLVKLNTIRDEYPIVMAVSAYDINFQEERSLNFAGKRNTVETNKILFCRRKIEERLNLFSAYGDAGIGARGLLNSTFPTINNTSFDPNAAITDQAGFNAFVDFMIDTVLQMGMLNYSPESRIAVVLSSNMMTRLIKSHQPSDSAISVMSVVRQRLEEAGLTQQQISFVTRTEASGAYMQRYANTSGKDRIAVYHLDPLVLSRSVENPLAQFMPEEYVGLIGTTRFYPMFSCASSTMIHDATRVTYTDHVAAT